MDFVTHVINQYQTILGEITHQAKVLENIRDRQEKKKITQKINGQVDQLLQRVHQDYPYLLAKNLALSILYQELSITSDMPANMLRSRWQEAIVGSQKQDISINALRKWGLIGLVDACVKSVPDMKALPRGSWFLQFAFTLAKPYISHDDEANYLIDNPVTKDHVLGLPLIRPSSWKGNLRSTLRTKNSWKDEQPEMVRLFGNPQGTEKDFRSGRLEFYPTFLYRVGLEVINPHDRARKVGKNPILMECVPAGAEGTFSLLYVPFDLIGRKSEDEIRSEAKEDLVLIAEAVGTMMLTYGFSAKRTSGFGTAEDKIDDGFVLTHQDKKRLSSLANLSEEVHNVGF